jgi:hypothetical protein
MTSRQVIPAGKESMKNPPDGAGPNAMNSGPIAVRPSNGSSPLCVECRHREPVLLEVTHNEIVPINEEERGMAPLSRCNLDGPPTASPDKVSLRGDKMPLRYVL